MAHAIRKVGIVGGGVIGAGWAARFVLNGIDVAIYDPDPEIQRKTGAVIANARRALARLFGQALPAEGTVTIAASLADAVRDADFIQESLLERANLKAHTQGAAVREFNARFSIRVCDKHADTRAARKQDGARKRDDASRKRCGQCLRQLLARRPSGSATDHRGP